MDYLDFFEEYKNKKQVSENLFRSLESKFGTLNENEITERIFPFLKGSQKSGGTNSNTQHGKYDLIKTPKGYQFGGPERSTLVIDNAQSEIDTYNWEQSPLKGLFEPTQKFYAKSISFDFKKGTISNFTGGQWIGPFNGRMFYGEYQGNSFEGSFSDKNENFKAHPTAFVNGTFNDTTRTGLLGLDNVVNATESDSFSLIQVPVGYSIEILTNKQLRHTITVAKRLDNLDSNFSYAVYMGYNIDSSTPNQITLPWERIRTEFNKFQFNSKTKSISGLFQLQSGEQIIEFRVLKAGTPPVFNKKEEFDETKQYTESSISLANGFSSLGSKERINLNFKLNNDQDFDSFNKMKGYFNSPQFTQDLDSIETFLDNKIINKNDLSKYPYLKKILTPEVLSEASFLKGSVGTKPTLRTPSGSQMSYTNPLTGQPLKDQADISAYLNEKYKDDLKIGRKDRYNKEYNDLYNQIILKKGRTRQYGSSSAPISQSQQQSKESDVVLKRLEDFVKNFVNKIDSDKARSFLFDAIIRKLKPNTFQTPVAQVNPIQTSAQNPAPVTSPFKSPKEESVIRLKVRDILKGIM